VIAKKPSVIAKKSSMIVNKTVHREKV